MKRYRVCVQQDVTGGGHYYVYDRQLFAECGLPVSESNVSAVRPLRWTYDGTIHGPGAYMAWDRAHRWLSRCVASWGTSPNVGGPHPRDVDWNAVEAALGASARGQEHREAAVHEHLA